MTLKWGLTDPGLRYVKGASAPKVHAAWKLEAVRNESVFAQAVLVCDEDTIATLGESFSIDWSGALARIRVEARWVDADGAELATPPGTVALRWVGYIPDDHGNQSADPIFAKESVTLKAGEVQPVWISIRTRESVEPGAYRLAINVYVQRGWEAEERIGSSVLTVHIRNLSLPDPRDYTFHLDLWQHPTRWSQYYNVPRWSEQHWNIIEAYARELARAGQKAVTVIASDAPWAGQGCWDVPQDPFAFYEFNMIQVTRSKAEGLRCRFDVLDRYIDTLAGAGIDQEIEVIGLLGAWHDVFGNPLTDYPDPIRIRLFDEDEGRFDFIRTKDELAEYIRQFVAHLRARGWFEKTRIASDEPGDLERFETCLAFLRGIDPELRFKIACNHASFIDEFKDDVLDWIPNLSSLTLDQTLSRRLRSEVQRRGGKMSWYICLRPAYPNTFFHSPLYETRLLGWLTHWFELDGFLRWAFAAWAPDTWNRPAWKFPGGDLFFVYPGDDGKPLASLRWDMLILAIQEFELLRMAQRAIDTVSDQNAKEGYLARLAEIVGQVVRVDALGEFRVDQKQPGELYATEYAAYDRARSELLDLLEELAGR